MKYYSELTKQFYNTSEDCEEAETKARREEEARQAKEKQKKEERAEAAKRVQKAYDTMVTAERAYKDELTSFCKTYGSYHTTVESFDSLPHLFSMFL